MERRRIDDLLAYLDRLAMINRDDVGYICTEEISECIDEIRKELISEDNSESYDALKRKHMREAYIEELKRISHKYRPNPFNAELLDAYNYGSQVTSLYVNRGEGATTSALALSNVANDVAFIVEYNSIKKHLNGKSVYTINELHRGSDVFKKYNVFIFDEVTDRNLLVEPLSYLQALGKRVIKIRSKED